MTFKTKVLHLCSKIPQGKVSTYGEIAKALQTSPRAVGGALKRNEHPIIIPCHRVIKSNGSIGGYAGSNPIKIREKIKLLKKEGIEFEHNKIKHFNSSMYRFNE